MIIPTPHQAAAEDDLSRVIAATFDPGRRCACRGV
jgi:hypothetical protein